MKNNFKDIVSTYHNVHVHTDLSLLDGVGFVSEYAEIASKANMQYLAVTDHGMAAAFPSLLEQAKKHKIKPVFGVEFYVNDLVHLYDQRTTLSPEKFEEFGKNYHLLAFAESLQGFENLIDLSTIGWTKGFYRKPRISFEQLAEKNEGIVITSACLASSLNQRLLENKIGEAKDIAKKWNEVFKDRFWLEWQMIGMEDQDVNNFKIFDLAEKLGLPTILTNDVHYALPEDAKTQEIILLLQSGSHTINDKKGFRFDSNQLWFTTEQEMDERYEKNYSDIPLDIYERSKEATLDLCHRCGYVQPDCSPKLPSVEGDKDILMEECLRSLCNLGLDKNKQYIKRFKKEYELICKKGFASYFLIQKEIIEAARDELGSCVGPGRGSVGGSLIAFLLDITEIDPIKHDTLFDRFLSPSRGGRQMDFSF